MTSKTLYSCTMSLDGFLAGPDGDMQWLTRHLGPNPVADDIVAHIGSLLVGRRTHGGDDPNRGTDKEGAFSGQWQGPVFVLTHNPPAQSSARSSAQSSARSSARSAQSSADTTFVTDLETGLAAAREAAGGRYVNILGADVARQCLARGLLDEILVLIAPVLLGDGTRLFDWPGGHSVDLRMRESSESLGTANLWYDVVR